MPSTKICPRCGEEYTTFPAISRSDNKTEICSGCGKTEGMLCWNLQQQGLSPAQIREVLSKSLAGDT
jgi:transposase